MSPRMAATTSSSTVRAAIPINSRVTRLLLTRSAHGVENATSKAWMSSTPAVITHAMVAVLS